MAREREPGVQELFDVMAACPASAFEGVAMRSVAPKYANPRDFVSGAGAARTGGRWSKRGLAAVYLSLSPMTAAAESFQGFRPLGFAGSSAHGSSSARGSLLHACWI